MKTIDLITYWAACFCLGILLSISLNHFSFYSRRQRKRGRPWQIALTKKDIDPKTQMVCMFFVNRGSYLMWSPVIPLVGEFQWWRTVDGKNWEKFGPVVSKPWEISPDIHMMKAGM